MVYDSELFGKYLIAPFIKIVDGSVRCNKTKNFTDESIITTKYKAGLLKIIEILRILFKFACFFVYQIDMNYISEKYMIKMLTSRIQSILMGFLVAPILGGRRRGKNKTFTF